MTKPSSVAWPPDTLIVTYVDGNDFDFEFKWNQGVARSKVIAARLAALQDAKKRWNPIAEQDTVPFNLGAHARAEQRSEVRS